MDFPDTIFALSSGALPSGIAIIRLSGPDVRLALDTVAGRIPAPRLARYATFTNPVNGAPIDRGIVLYFPGPESVTGEDCGELHVHGGRAVVEATLDALGTIPGLRLADPGEFSRRAFLNGKMDLTGVEALSDLIAAETEAQRRLAYGNAAGAARDLYLDWSRRILRLRARIEADLDFSDQEDVPERDPSLSTDISEIAAEIDHHVGLFRKSEMIRDGFRIVILGAPNAGKSSLLNALAMRDVAIVTPEPGTTRDIIEVALDIHGNKVLMSDTAGLREEPGAIEAIGIERAMHAAESADLVLHLVDMCSPTLVDMPHGRFLRVGSKRDLAPDSGVAVDLTISSKSGEGLAELLEKIGQTARSAIGADMETLPFRVRHIRQLHSCKTHLERAIDTIAPEIQAEELRIADAALGEIVGRTDVEELLGEIFSTFCIGK